jgi:hypothetical protein
VVLHQKTHASCDYFKQNIEKTMQLTLARWKRNEHKNAHDDSSHLQGVKEMSSHLISFNCGKCKDILSISVGSKDENLQFPKSQVCPNCSPLSKISVFIKWTPIADDTSIRIAGVKLDAGRERDGTSAEIVGVLVPPGVSRLSNEAGIGYDFILTKTVWLKVLGGIDQHQAEIDCFPFKLRSSFKNGFPANGIDLIEKFCTVGDESFLSVLEETDVFPERPVLTGAKFSPVKEPRGPTVPISRESRKSETRLSSELKNLEHWENWEVPQSRTRQRFTEEKIESSTSAVVKKIPRHLAAILKDQERDRRISQNTVLPEKPSQYISPLPKPKRNSSLSSISVKSRASLQSLQDPFASGRLSLPLESKKETRSSRKESNSAKPTKSKENKPVPDSKVQKSSTPPKATEKSQPKTATKPEKKPEPIPTKKPEPITAKKPEPKEAEKKPVKEKFVKIAKKDGPLRDMQVNKLLETHKFNPFQKSSSVTAKQNNPTGGSDTDDSTVLTFDPSKYRAVPTVKDKESDMSPSLKALREELRDAMPSFNKTYEQSKFVHAEKRRMEQLEKKSKNQPPPQTSSLKKFEERFDMQKVQEELREDERRAKKRRLYENTKESEDESDYDSSEIDSDQFISITN